MTEQEDEDEEGGRVFLECSVFIPLSLVQLSFSFNHFILFLQSDISQGEDLQLLLGVQFIIPLLYHLLLCFLFSLITHINIGINITTEKEYLSSC